MGAKEKRPLSSVVVSERRWQPARRCEWRLEQATTFAPAIARWSGSATAPTIRGR